MSLKDTSAKLRVYDSQGHGKYGLGIWKQIAVDMLNSVDIIYPLAMRDIVIKYRQSILGLFWVIILPLVTTLLFTYLVNNRIVNIDSTAIPYPLFVLTNFCIWQLFSGIIFAMTNSLVNAGSMITKVNFPKLAVVLAAIFQPTLDFFVKLFVIVAAYIWVGYVPHVEAFMIIILMIPLIVIGVAIGVLFSIIALVLKDISHILTILLTAFMFITPVFYASTQNLIISKINMFNPLVPIFNSIQSLIINGSIDNYYALLVSLSISIIFLLLAMRVFVLALPKVVEYA